MPKRSLGINTVHPQTTRPIPRERLAEFIQAVEAAEWPTEKFPWTKPDPRKVVLFLLFTGAHPRVLATPKECSLNIWHGRVIFYRPKTRKQIDVALDPKIAPWAKEFIASLPEIRSVNPTVYYTTMVQKFCASIGFPHVTPRTLRHTLGRQLYVKTRDLQAVMRTLRTSAGVATIYAREVDSTDVDRMIKSGTLWSEPADEKGG